MTPSKNQQINRLKKQLEIEKTKVKTLLNLILSKPEWENHLEKCGLYQKTTTKTGNEHIKVGLDD